MQTPETRRAIPTPLSSKYRIGKAVCNFRIKVGSIRLSNLKRALFNLLGNCPFNAEFAPRLAIIEKFLFYAFCKRRDCNAKDLLFTLKNNLFKYFKLARTEQTEKEKLLPAFRMILIKLKHSLLKRINKSTSTVQNNNDFINYHFAGILSENEKPQIAKCLDKKPPDIAAVYSLQKIIWETKRSTSFMRDFQAKFFLKREELRGSNFKLVMTEQTRDELAGIHQGRLKYNLGNWIRGVEDDLRRSTDPSKFICLGEFERVFNHILLSPIEEAMYWKPRHKKSSSVQILNSENCFWAPTTFCEFVCSFESFLSHLNSKLNFDR